MFIGRNRELVELEKLYSSRTFQCVIVWGRRRVGKTTLLREFFKKKAVIHFTAIQTSPAESLAGFSRAILAPDGGSSPVFPDWEVALDYLAQQSRTKRLALVIDEYPYLAQSYQTISSLLQSWIDQKFKQGQLFLVLCGSSMSFMEHQVLGYQSPLYGRRTAQFKLEPFGFNETCRFFTRLSAENLAIVHGITGGIPLYLEKIDQSKSLKSNIIENFLTPSAYLFEEPLNLLKQEVRDPALYNAIIQGIAEGRSRLSEIAGKAGLETSACTQYVKNLIELGIIRKELPLFSKSSRRGAYSISDSLFRFWYRFVMPNLSMIQNGLAETVWKHIDEQLPVFMGREFENICLQFMWLQNTQGKLPFELTEMGRWWGTDPELKAEAELDIVGCGRDKRLLLGECKWSNKAVDSPVLETLIDRARLLPYQTHGYYLFAKTGFTARCRVLAEDRGDVTLFTFPEMVSLLSGAGTAAIDAIEL